MRTKCAWCGRHMKGDQADTVVSHGICPACLERQLADLKALVLPLKVGEVDNLPPDAA